MEDNTSVVYSMTKAVDHLCQNNAKCSSKLGWLLSKQIWSPSDRSSLMESLTQLFLDPLCTQDICSVFQPIILDIAERCRTFVLKKGSENIIVLSKFAVALSLGLSQAPDLKKISLEFLSTYRPFSQSPGMAGDQPTRKKKRREKLSEVELCEAMWRFVQGLGDSVGDAITLDMVVPHLSHHVPTVRWYAALTIAELLQMSANQRRNFLGTYFTEEEKRQLTVKFELDEFPGRHDSGNLVETTQSETKLSYTMQGVVHEDFSETVIEVAGILLPKVQQDSQAGKLTELVPVASMMSNLRSLALAVVSGAPVLLQGPVGSGKTTLVEHLASLTGRKSALKLLKIQLGDQTDSKALLGTYRCTEVPGEFMWQPGILTRAVTEGLWVLLEDIDFAPMDVVSVLLPLLETGSLTVPGHGDNVRAHPGFRLFATQRLVGGMGGWHRQKSGSSLLLEKMWTKINVEPLSRQELQQVIVTRFPKLSTVVDKLLDIYLMLSAGKHDADTPDLNPDPVGRFHSLAGRLVSTRDLMTWVSRVSQDFDVSSTDAGPRVFQEALDCFVSCLPKQSKRLPLAEAIGSKLNVSKVKVEFYTLKYKPNLEMSDSSFTAGRVVLPRKQAERVDMSRLSQPTFAYTRQSVSLLEKVGVCVSRGEPVLLVGETGTGKTSSVQFLGHQLGHKLHVINLNQQSDSTDLLGGFKPVDLKFVIMPFREDFEILFLKTFSRKQNAKFLGHIQECFARRRWSDLLTLMEHTQKSAVKKFHDGTEEQSSWIAIGKRLRQLQMQVKQIENALAFSFIEGTLVKALRCGDWVLLDEINLAAAETLECLSGLLESSTGSVVLTERGDIEPIVRHPEFRLFACMNPATDVGKKDLTPGIRNRFTELYVDELEESSDLKILVNDYLKGLSLSPGQVDGIVRFYLTVRTEAVKHLTDGTGHKPHFSLRTLCRALKFSSSNPCGLVARSLYEGFCLSFLTQLDRPSHPLVEKLVCQHVVGKANIKAILSQKLPMPVGGKHLSFEGYWISQGTLEPHVPEHYILTPSVRENLRDLARIISASQHPVLLQGETSVGKTSLITWLAQSTGNPCVRVNNHEHTDLQEYVGCYAADETGKLVFKEGVLVEAMRKGYWIILDELNLAPTDVLEALNRLLDDNRELFIPETQETVKAHPKFMLFATQNPPGLYGGRKMLSRAFRNRFVELHFSEIPSKELETILHQRCNIPLSYAKRLVQVMLDLQMRRRGSGVFAGKQGFMTLRDLFRWAERYSCSDTMTSSKFYDWDQHLADHGYMLLAGRVRKEEESMVIQEVLKKHLKREVNPALLFDLSPKTSTTTAAMLKQLTDQSVEGFQHIVWTHNMRRLAVLIGQAIAFKEPVLLVGETGCGKTTMCQMFAAVKNRNLYSVNCHLHTESADFLGGLRPVRSHSEEEDPKEARLFEWLDGPLVRAMKEGSMFLIDEISLADDSVLERLNSVLEPERTLLLAEKGGGDGGQNEVQKVKAVDGFHVFSTMNPGGDFGKKELSPALRNRFTEIWCPQLTQREDLEEIIEHNISDGIQLGNQQDGRSGFGAAILDFIEWFSNNEIGKRCTVSIRDILTWVNFVNTCARPDSSDVTMEIDGANLEPAVAYIHGACLVFLDGLGSGLSSRGSGFDVESIRDTCLQFLVKQITSLAGHDYTEADLHLSLQKEVAGKMDIISTKDTFSIPPFSISKGDSRSPTDSKYALQAPTTCLNAQRVLRALQLPRPLLLEGSPGVGKTSLVSAIARSAGRELVRINLSEQTDVTDLFGADLPVEGAEGGRFAWRDGPLLQALKAGHWVVLDELNLASQSVLEGLNACLDHRAEVFIPELGRTFSIQHEKTRLFACQNPLNQGGGRKGLPRSFLNRFTQVYVEPLSQGDLMFIASAMYPSIPCNILSSMVDFNMAIHRVTMVESLWGHRGGPWEFNLRDLFRWCDLLLANQPHDKLNPGEYLKLVYSDRMRTLADRTKVADLYEQIFTEHKDCPLYNGSRYCHVGESHVQIGHSFLSKVNPEPRSRSLSSLQLLHHHLDPLESLAMCARMNWMAVIVGPQSCGKTSVVRLLAELTGNTLHVLPMNSAMDTTELLGGFEQADIFRHVEEVGMRTLGLVKEIQREILCYHPALAANSVKTLQSEWAAYTQPDIHGATSSSVEEFERLKSNVKTIQSTVLILDKICEQNNISLKRESLEEIQSRIKHLAAVVSKTSRTGGSTGGTFEWVDSLLVKALQAGHWLLIDNVNFCSPSVLDRLNALLEPGGVLSINERGVIDGKIPTITPHPHFRLFLAMDPKFGEISRAMRNRGIEIYMPGEEDHLPYSSHDTKQMMKGLGLVQKHHCDWLISLHSEMKERLPRNEQPMIVDLLCATVTTVQQLERGVTGDKALYHAANDVYVRSLKTFDSKQTARTILSEHINRLEEGVLTHEPGLWPLSMCGSREYVRNPVLANITKQGAALAFLIGQSISSQNSEGKHDTAVVTRQTTMLRTSLELFISCLPERDWQMGSIWFGTLLSKLLENTKEVSSEESRLGWTLKDYLKTLPEVFSLCLKKLSDQPISTEYKNTLSALCGEELEASLLVSEQSWQIEWNPHFIQKLHKLSTSQLEDRDKLVLALQSHSHKICLQTHLTVMFRHVQPLIDKLKDFCLSAPYGSSSTATALLHLSNMVDELETGLSALVEGFKHLSEEKLNKLLSSLPWLCRLLCVTKQWRQTSPDSFLCLLSLHWNWFSNKTLHEFTDSQTISSSSTKLNSAIAQLQKVLGQDNMAAKRFERFWEGFGHPPAFVNETEAELAQRWREVQNLVSVYGEAPTGIVAAKVKAMTRDGYQVRKKMLEVARLILDRGGEADSVVAILEEVKALLKGHGLVLSSEMDTDSVPDTTLSSSTSVHLPVSHVELWPMFDHLSLLAHLSVISGVSGSSLSHLSHLNDFSLYHTPDTPVHLKRLAQNREEQRGLEILLSRQVLHRLWTSPAARNPEQWLLWNRAMEDGDEKATSHRGPGVFQMSPVTNFAFHLLSNGHIQSEASTLPVNVPLSRFDDLLEVFGLLSRHLWCHATTLTRPENSIRSIAMQFLLKNFLHMLRAVQTLLSLEDKAQCAAILDDLHLAVEQKTLTGAHVRQTHSCFQCVADSLDSLSVPVISRSFEVVQDLVDSQSKDERDPGLKDVGRGLVYVGLAQMILLAPRGPVDPMEKQAVKLQHVQDELLEVEAELEVIDMQIRIETGRGLEDSGMFYSHPRVRYLLTRRDKLQVKKTHLENTQVYRPQSSQFFMLAQDVQSFMESVGSTNHITAILSKLLTLHQSIQDGRHDSVTRGSCVQEERVWQVTLHKFLGRLEVEYPLYKDLLEPFMLAVQQVSLGIRFICQEVDTMANKLKFDRPDLSEQTVSCLSRFPSVCAETPSMLHLSEVMVADVTVQTVKVFCSLQKGLLDTRGKENEIVSRLLMNGLQLVKGHCLTSQELSPRVLYSLSRLFAACLQAWQDQETRRKEREDEKEALYKYKARTHGDERSESEQLEDDFKSSFPSYVKDFEDVTGKTSLEGSGDDTDDASAGDLASAPDSISESEMSKILDTHQKLFTTLTETSWIEKPDRSQSRRKDYVTSALSNYSVGAVLGKMGSTALTSSLDTETLGGHLLVCAAVETSVRGSLSTNQDADNPLASALSSTFNIYTDSNVAEVIQCRPVMDRFSARIAELQQEWPDHPTLKMLENIVQRVLSFPVTSPIMKFLAGLELLLEKSQDWEANAAAHVSMATQLADVTTMIIQWRKLELSCWSRSLDTEMEKMKLKASRWWFHIYQLVMSYLDPHQHQLDSEEQNPEPTAEDVLKSLEQFLETSSLGEFQFRLQMIYAFHCQLANMDASDKQGLMMNMLWNVYKFYSQFLENVEADVTRQRTPIEKELKGFVKIARWNDMNYWALKQTTEKTHRTVHKHTKAFQTILQQPVQGLLTERTEGGHEDARTSVADRLQDVHNLSVAKVKESPSEVPAAPSISSGSLQLRLPTLTLKIRKHWRRILSKIKYTQLITVLDEFTGEIIESVHELQAEEVTPGLEKEKQRSEAKLMNLRKRKALSDLFKHLALTGLSYRKGLTMTQEVQKGMLSTPLDVHAALGDTSSPLCALWEDCHKYFYRCVARKARLDVALHTPSKDLGIGNIDRCRGFVEHLMHVLMGQQTSLAAMFDKYLQLRKITTSLYKTRSTPDQPSLPPQKETKEWIERVKTVTVELLEGLSQFQILLYTCPSRTDTTSLYPSPYPPSELSPLALVHQGDELWRQCVEGVAEMLTVVQATQDTILNIKGDCCQWSDVSILKSVVKQYRDLIPSISRISSKFQDPVSNTGSCLNQSLVFLEEELGSLCQQFQRWEESVEDLQESIREMWVKDSRTKELHSGVITRSKARQMDDADVKASSEIGVVTRSRSLRGQGDSEVKGSGTKELDSDTTSPKRRSLKGESDVSETRESQVSAEVEKFSDEVEAVIAAALLVVQDLVKAHAEASGDVKSKEGEEESSFQEGHLTKLLVDSLSADITLLQYNKVTELLGSLTDRLMSMVDAEAEKTNGDSHRCLIQLLRCYPMMHQYQQIIEYFLAQLIGLFRTTGKLLSVLLGVFTELATKGFCIPPEFTEEVDGEGATDFEDITGGGLGEGQGAKDVSEQIESEDQLDETRQQGADQQEKGEEPDVAPEDNAIEMSENFEGKMDDAEMKEGEDSDQEEPDTDELDKQMGELDAPDADRLDEQMWGSDDEEEETEEQQEEKKEESGPGAGQESETQVVAKDDNEDKTEADDNGKSEKDEKKDGEEENREEQKPHELEEFDENEYDEDKVDPHHGNQGPEQEPEALDLPEDLNLDENEAGKEEEETGPPDVEPDNQDGGGEEMDENEQTDVPELEEQTRDEEQEENMDDEKEEPEGKEKDCEEIKEEKGEKNTEEEEQGKGDSGITPQDEEGPEPGEQESKETEESVETAEERGKTSHETQDVEMTDAAQDEAATGDSEQKEQQGTGVSQSEEQEGHEGEKSTQVTEGGAAEQNKQFKRRPGQSDEDRSLGSRDEKFKKLKTMDQSRSDQTEDRNQEEKASKESSLYEHIKESSSQHDAQTLDVASAEQQEEQPVANQNEEEEAQPMGEEEDLQLQEDLKEEKDKSEVKEAKKIGKDGKQTSQDMEQEMDVDTVEKMEVEGEVILTHGAQRGPDTTIHTVLEHLHIETTLSEIDEEKLRAELEENVATWCHQETASAHAMAAASEAWQQYDALTSSLAQELCEQLRLVLEPSQATKLRGDYRTGKRLNMRKVIPYIASQFRKDKIWLRRTKPSKRQYQIMLAIDDSSSMLDNHSKQLAFESLALISNALTLLESGELAVCSFGESVRQLHSFTEQFTNQSGASILQHFTFEQKKTKIAQLLRQSTSIMLDARKRQHSGVGHPETSQLLLIVSDGRGLFNEGMEVVQSAVRQAREANIFLVFVIIDNPQSKDSILDIKVPVFKGAGQLPEIKSYMESFPFPFYIILRDINSLPQTLSDALRQWFELVTASDRT